MIGNTGLGTTDIVFIVIGLIILSSSLAFIKKIPKYLGYLAIVIGVVLVMRGVLTLDRLELYIEPVINFLVEVANKITDIFLNFIGKGNTF